MQKNGLGKGKILSVSDVNYKETCLCISCVVFLKHGMLKTGTYQFLW